MAPACRTLVAVALLAVLAGCLGGAEGSPAAPAGSTAPADPADASAHPDPDKSVRLENDWNRSVEVRLSVVREATNETVHEGTYTLDPGTERAVYDVADADPDGVESFRVTATARTATGTVTIETSACSTDAYVEITSSGNLYPFRGVC